MFSKQTKIKFINGYARSLHDAVDFFRSFREYKEIAFCKPSAYTRWDGFALYVNLILAQSIALRGLFWFTNFNPFTAFNALNVWFNAKIMTHGCNRQTLLTVYWIQYAGVYVDSKLIFKNPDGTIEANSFTERMLWLKENVRDGDWTVYDVEHWLRRLGDLKNAAGSVSMNVDDMRIQYVFKKRRDAMLFKLTFGND